jgi:tetratricopeptide (TPR) repeat protein
MLGRQEYDKAIDYLRAGLKGDKSDYDSLSMIANCHHWAGHHDQAIVVGEEALKLDPGSFDMHALLAELFAVKGDHENAIVHARKGLECYPEPVPTVPNSIISVFRLLGRIFPSLRDADPNEGLRSVEASRAEWFSWAKQYLIWHDATHGGTGAPVVH